LARSQHTEHQGDQDQSLHTNTFRLGPRA
jgi:hypothetical protein